MPHPSNIPRIRPIGNALQECITLHNGSKAWYCGGALHRDDGPAIECIDGTKRWYKDGLLHRDDGPAEIYPAGTKLWFQDGLLHRLDGPAIESRTNLHAWYVRGRRLTEAEFYLYVDHLTGELVVPVGKKLRHDDKQS